MAYLNETESFDEGVYRLETTDLVQGGENGTSNKPLKALANRTKWLKKAVDTINTALGTINTALSGLKSASTRDASTVPGNGIVPLWDAVYSKAQVDAAIESAVNSVVLSGGKRLASGTCVIGDIIGSDGVTKMVSLGKTLPDSNYIVTGSIVSKGNLQFDLVWWTVISSSRNVDSFSVRVTPVVGADAQNVDLDWIIWAK